MSKEKQIEKLTLELIKTNSYGTLNAVAEHLYNVGYRKQKVGRWVHNEDHNAYESPYFCSECLADCTDIRGENYCYNCGAKMKGGAE